MDYNEKIYIYLHICTIETWETVVSTLFTRLKDSGLLEVCTEFRVAVLGDKVDKVKEILAHPKTKIIFHSLDLSLYERPALTHLRMSAELDEFYAFYFHSKGIRKKNDPYRENINDWIDMMCYFLIDRFIQCLELLKKYPAVGVNYVPSVDTHTLINAVGHTQKDSRHFSGNFWWARSDYIRSLPTIIRAGYLNPELWIGSGNGILYSVHQSNVQHYYNRYPSTKYIESDARKSNAPKSDAHKINNEPHGKKISVSSITNKAVANNHTQAKTHPNIKIHTFNPPVPVKSPKHPWLYKMQKSDIIMEPFVSSELWKDEPVINTDPHVNTENTIALPTETPLINMIDTDLSTIKANITEIPSPRPIYIYFHICTIGHWEQIVKRLFNRIIESGLINIVKNIFVIVLGRDLGMLKKILNHPKVNIIFHSYNTAIYERKALLSLREKALYEDFNVLYLHSKGVTRFRQQCIRDWIELMTYFTIENHKKCIEMLSDYDTCGVNLNKAPDWVLKRSATNTDVELSYHYSGNFWWAKSEYIRTLPGSIGSKYIDPELWIGSAEKKKMVSLWQSNVDHYKSCYPSLFYVGKNIQVIYET